jgi:hypothetical protein
LRQQVTNDTEASEQSRKETWEMSKQGKRGWQGQGRRGRPNRDRPDIDRGTPELRAHRERLAAGGDPALTEYPLGLLLARTGQPRAA